MSARRLFPRLLAAALATGLLSATVVAADNATCAQSTLLLESAATTLGAMHAGDAPGAARAAAALVELIGPAAEAVGTAAWPNDYVAILDETAMLADSIIERAGDTDSGDAEGLAGYSATLNDIHRAQCGTPASAG
jgi:hypothetical protein